MHPVQAEIEERARLQRMDALAKGDEIRLKRAQLKRDLKAGKVRIHDILLDPPDFVDNMKLFDMLLAVPKYGRVKVDGVLRLSKISPTIRIGGLTERQRMLLCSYLRR